MSIPTAPPAPFDPRPRRRRSRLLGVHVSPDEHELIRRAAALSDSTMSDWLRGVIARALADEQSQQAA